MRYYKFPTGAIASYRKFDLQVTYICINGHFLPLLIPHSQVAKLNPLKESLSPLTLAGQSLPSHNAAPAINVPILMGASS